MILHTSYNICEDWGWFIDLENETYKIPSSNLIKLKRKNKNVHYNKFEEDEYDEYDYYIKNKRDIEILPIEDVPFFKKNEEYTLYKIGSTTFITVLITCFICFGL